MKFINRKHELQFLHECHALSKKKLFSVAIYGLRRVGKTRLMLEFIKGKGVYFYVTKNKTSFSLLKEFEGILKENNVISELEQFSTWEKFFETIFNRYNGIIIFDEFQNFYEIDKSVFGILQKYVDLNEERNNLLFIFAGSIIGLSKKIFRDKREPLYGRLKREMFLKQLSFKNILDVASELKIHNIEEVISLYALLGGFPLYYVAIEDENLQGKTFLDIVEKFFLSANAVFEEEVEKILSLELGKRKGRYYDIIAAIAQGNRTIAAISSYLSIKETKLTRYINELITLFEIICQEGQVIGGKKFFVINSPIINFWFKFFYRDLSLYKSRNKRLIENIRTELNSYIGRRFELVCKEFLSQTEVFDFDIIGRQWGKFEGEPGKNTYEIDLVALNHKTKDILFVECKWKENINAEQILAELKEKSKYVQWNNDNRKEHFCIIAKSFKKKLDKKECFCYDLDDFEKTFNKK